MPLFGSVATIEDKLVSNIDYGLPFFRFKRGQKPHVKIINKTGFTFNLHWHGLNTTADVDGASTEVVFGKTTKIGTKLDLNFPTINNNSALLWLHAHPMFTETPLLTAGLKGLVDIVDDASSTVTDEFKYGDNRLLLVYEDMDLNKDGTFSFANLTTDENRSCFGVVNGVSCINWYSSPPLKPEPFFDSLEHTTTKNLVKIDILNGASSWRYIYVGLADKAGGIRSFYQIQSDTGLMNPTPLTMLSLAPAGRVAILYDASEFPDGVAHVFMYNFDLTSIFDTVPANPGNPKDPTLLGTVPDLRLTKDPSPYPTPIPDSATDPANQQGDPSLLTYPLVPIIPQTTEILDNGSIVPPQVSGLPYSIKKFLKIKWRPLKDGDKESKESKEEKKCTTVPPVDSLEKMLKKIKKVVFGE